MGFLDSIKAAFSGNPSRDDGYWVHVRCRRCGEGIRTRLDLKNNLTPHDEGGYIVRKTLVGNKLCFERIEAKLFFDEQRRLVNQEISGGELITAEEFEELQESTN